MEDRIKSIDVLRGLSVVLMVTGHIYYYWTNTFPNIYGEIINFIVISAAPIFPLVSGFSYYFYINRRILMNTPKKETFKRVFIRAAFIFFISTLFTYFFGSILGLEFTFIIYWSIFQLIAFSMLLFFILPFLNQKIRLYVYIGLFFFFFFITHIIILFKIEFLYILTNVGNFPLLPWGNFFLLGIFFGDFIKNNSENEINENLIIITSIGICLITIFFLWMRYITYLYLDIFFKNLGIFFIFFPVLYYYLDLKVLECNLQKRLIQWGNVAFSMYYIHFGVISIGVLLFPLIIGNMLFNGFNLIQYLIIVAIILIALDIFLRIWQKFNFIFGIEWLMNKFTQKSLFKEKSSNF